MSWLDELKVGDEVILHSGSWGEPTIKTVYHVTKQHVCVDSWGKFRKKDGRAVSGGRTSISEPIPSELQEIRDKQEHDGLVRRLSDLSRGKWDDLTTDQLRRIVAILDEPKPNAGERE